MRKGGFGLPSYVEEKATLDAYGRELCGSRPPLVILVACFAASPVVTGQILNAHPIIGENVRLQHQLKQATLIIELPKKVSELLGVTLPPPPPDATDEQH